MVGGYEVVAGWGEGGARQRADEVHAVAVSPDGTVYSFARHPARVEVRDRGGILQATWIDPGFSDRPHGLLVRDGVLYCVDAGQSAVWLLDAGSGRRLGVIGEPGADAASGVDWSAGDTRSRLLTITHGAPPFNRPTGIAATPTGDLLVSDGYGNCRVHRFSADHRLLASWGDPGSGPGQFHLPHGIAVDAEGRVLVADRENDRVQVFSASGEPVDAWTDVRLPSSVAVGPDGLVVVAELGMPAWRASLAHPAPSQDIDPRVTVRTPDGRVVADVGRRDGDPEDPSVLLAPHAVAVDDEGAVYVGELALALATSRDLVDGAGDAARLPSLKKFVPTV